MLTDGGTGTGTGTEGQGAKMDMSNEAMAGMGPKNGGKDEVQDPAEVI